MARMKNPNYRVNLDEIGTWIWLRCDGQHTVEQLAKGLKDEFGDRVEPVHERLTLFLRQLVRGRFIVLRKATSPTERSPSKA